MDRVRPESNPEAVHDKPRVVLRAKGRCHGNPNVVTTTIRLSACRCVSECAAPETKQKTVGICQTNERNERDEFRFARRAFGRVTGETRRRPTVSLFFFGVVTLSSFTFCGVAGQRPPSKDTTVSFRRSIDDKTAHYGNAAAHLSLPQSSVAAILANFCGSCS